ncbi:MAG: sulfotransferase domain-containing protein [Chloroflexota bacterium]
MLLHIGLHKTGTTWLQVHLFRDSVVGFANLFSPAELNHLMIYTPTFGYDGESVRAEIERRSEEARSRGLYPVISNERFSGSPEHGGHDSQYVADRLKQLVPDARVLIVIREQKSMALSFYKQYIWTGGHLALKYYLRPSSDSHGEMFLIEQLEYDRVIAYYQKLFGRENVCVLAYELFRQSPAAYVSAIAQFCGLSLPADAPVTTLYKERTNRSLSPFQTRVTKHLNFWFGTQKQLRHGILPLLHFKQVKKMRRYTHKIERRLPERYKQSLEAKAVREIEVTFGHRFQQSNAETVRLTGLDLKAFGYDLPE